MKNVFAIILAQIFVAGVFLFGFLIGSWQIDKPEPIQPNTAVSVTIDATNWNLSVEHIKSNEGLRLIPYKLDGLTFVGYGHLITSRDPQYYSSVVTEIQADEILYRDLMNCVEYAAETFDVNGNQALAIGLLFYNVRPSSIYDSGLFGILKSKAGPIRETWLSLCNFQGNEHAGLKKRREFEIKLYFND